MITIEGFNEIRDEYGCGYYNICCDHGCSCALDGEDLDEKIYKKMKDDYNKEIEYLRKQYGY